MENKKRLIDLDKLIKPYKALAQLDPYEYIPPKMIVEELENQPLVDAVEVVHGRWEKHGKHDWRCSVCKVGVPYSFTGHNYCHNCGADMRGKTE